MRFLDTAGLGMRLLSSRHLPFAADLMAQEGKLISEEETVDDSSDNVRVFWSCLHRPDAPCRHYCGHGSQRTKLYLNRPGTDGRRQRYLQYSTGLLCGLGGDDNLHSLRS